VRQYREEEDDDDQGQEQDKEKDDDDRVRNKTKRRTKKTTMVKVMIVSRQSVFASASDLSTSILPVTAAAISAVRYSHILYPARSASGAT